MGDDVESEYARQGRESLVVTKHSKAEVWEQKRRLASALRTVIERVVPSDAPAAELSRAADALERYAEQLEQHPRLQRRMGIPRLRTPATCRPSSIRVR